jgi:broad specificity phosphatase PhoE
MRYRSRMKRVLLLALAAIVFASSLNAAPHPVTTVILVRHAEKLSQDDASPLTPAGTDRAKELARVLTGVKFDVIYETQFRRVHDTAAPVAAAAGITPLVRKAGSAFPTYAADLAKEILAEHRGQTILVVGHSNTTVDVLKALGATNVAPIEDRTEFDNLFVLTEVDGAAPKVVALRYGAVAH